MEQHTTIIDLLLKHLRQELTPEESAALDTWVAQSGRNRQFFAAINNTPELMSDVRAYGEGQQIDVDVAWTNMIPLVEEIATTSQPAKIVHMKWWRYVAAAVLLIIAISIYLLRPANKPSSVPVVVKGTNSDATPKTSKATLTLDNGITIVLDSSASGLLAEQGNTKVAKYSDGVLRYTGGKATGQKLIYNTVTVPKGSDVVYLQLADGSKVWLNAASTIRYPVAFSDNERKVEITGEAYFEVTTTGDKKRFVVSKGNMNVIVLGTRFNVNTYDNEDNIKVTLLEGSVKVQSDKMEKTIKPGQQAVLNENKINVLTEVDLEEVMAWKEGKFVFNATNIQLIMRQMERWYDLEPTRYINEEVKKWEFNGEISRYSSATKVLQLLEKTGSVKFTLEGKKINVTQP